MTFQTEQLCLRYPLPHKNPTATLAIRDMLNQIELNQTLHLI